MSEAPLPNVPIATCPGCGAKLRFTVGASRLVVCEYCGFAVARTDGGIRPHGQMADLVPTGTRLALGARGEHEGVGFRLAGRLQLRWEHGVWDEWYVAFDDGRWGWLAEAQGRYFVTYRVTHRPVPPYPSLRPGREVFLHGLGAFVVSDRKEARLAGVRGEVPSSLPVEPDALLLSIDLSGRGGAFATFDYGPRLDDGQAEEPPELFVGREVSFDALHVSTDHLPPTATAAPRAKAKALKCPQCAAPVPLQAPDSAQRVTCGHCRAFIDATHEPYSVLAVLKAPRIPFKPGSRATFFGTEYVLTGWMRRSCRVEGETYHWQEYLLFDERTAAFRWLVDSDGHWSFVTPVPPGNIEHGTNRITWQGRSFKRFSVVSARVTRVYGEFYWAVSVGETALAIDWIRPPEGISEERTEDEVHYSHAVYVTPEDVWAAFGVKRRPRAPKGVGSLQPLPWEDAAREVRRSTPVAVAAIVLLFLVFLVRSNEVPIHQETAALGSLANASRREGVVHFTRPFAVNRALRNLEISIESDVNQNWVFIAGALVNEASGEVREFTLESSYYSGRDSDGRWVEDRRKRSVFLSTVPMGTWVLRTESAWPKGPAPRLEIEIRSGVARLSHFLLALGALLLAPAVVWIRRAAFEHSRWEQSTEGGS